MWQLHFFWLTKYVIPYVSHRKHFHDHFTNKYQKNLSVFRFINKLIYFGMFTHASLFMQSSIYEWEISLSFSIVPRMES